MGQLVGGIILPLTAVSIAALGLLVARRKRANVSSEKSSPADEIV